MPNSLKAKVHKVDEAHIFRFSFCQEC